MGLCKHFVHKALFLNAHYAKCLHRPIVIINQQYTKREIDFINATQCFAHDAYVFLSIFGVDTSINPNNITMITYFISALLNDNFDLDVSVAIDVTIDVAKCALLGKVMQ